MSNSCFRNIKGASVIGQHLFLGSSILSFSNNLGWGGTTSTLNIELVNDMSACGNNTNIFSVDPASFPDNHYYDCSGDNCYIDENSQQYEFGKSRDQIVPGKVYHSLRNNNLVSKYWVASDPGFIGDITHIDPYGRYNPNATFSYNIIGCPVYFRFGYFTFGGFVTSWERSNRQNVISYTVTISSADELLQNAKVIIDHYAGAIFARYSGSFGGPVNVIDNRLNYSGQIKDGNIPNVFNVYGFLESYGFGASNRNDDGIPLAYVLDALSVLTSTSDISTLGTQKAFSPFGRIIAPTVVTNSTSPMIPSLGDYGFGLVPPVVSTDNNLRSVFTLDLSEIPRPPLDIRISAPDSSISISDLLRVACEKTGRDFYTTVIRKNGINVIKVKTINRTIPVSSNAVSALVQNIENQGIGTTTTSFGKEHNKYSPKVMYIGGNQQRLYQAKSYMLAYTQTNYIYNPVINKFINYNRFSGKGSAIKIPNFLSTKNTVLNKQTIGAVNSELFDGNEIIRQSFTGDIFNKEDIEFSDSNVGGTAVPWVGNYFSSFSYGGDVKYSPPRGVVVEPVPPPSRSSSPSSASGTGAGGSTSGTGAGGSTSGTGAGGSTSGTGAGGSTSGTGAGGSTSGTGGGSSGGSGGSGGTGGLDSAGSASSKNRYIPLINHAICPFFGYKFNEQVEISTTSNNIFRYIRPVLLDSWTGQLVVSMTTRELPILSLGSMTSLYATDPDLPGNLPLEGSGLKANDTTEEEDPPANTQLPEVEDKKKITKTVSLSEFGFKITETEIRAAMAGFDSYLAYCLAKYRTEKPDLFVMLVNLYKKLDKLTVLPIPGFPSNSQSVGDGYSTENQNYTGEAKQRSDKPNPEKRKTDINFGLTLSYEFMNDLRILVDFVKNIGDKYYGRKYLVRLPGLMAYRDKAYSDIQIASSAGDIAVYQGSGKIFFDKELADGAWEEYGNSIDDCIIIGGPAYYKLIDDKGLIKPILGYNASYNYDDASKLWCEQSDEMKAKQLKHRQNRNIVRQKDTDPVVANKKDIREYDQAWANRIGASINCERKIVPSINLSSIGQDYCLINTLDVRQDAFGRKGVVSSGVSEQQSSGNDEVIRSVFSAPSRKVYVTTSCDDIAFFDPSTLTGPRAIVDAPGVELFSSSYAYTKDPNLTVIANVAIEDMAILEKKKLLTADLKRLLLSYCIPILDTGFLVSEGDTSDQSSKHEMIHAKMAHPLFAGIPLKSNLYCYGPWTNYPSLANRANVFPGLIDTSSAMEQLIGDTKVEKRDEFVPWQTGGTSMLDLLVLNTLSAELSYQSILENGQVSVYGPPLFGLGGSMMMGVTDSDIHNLLGANIYGFNCLYLNKAYIESYAGLTLSNISTYGSTNGVSTNYSFRTYSQKLGIYSKENADRIKQFSTSRISLMKKLTDAQAKFEQKITDQINRIMANSSKSRTGESLSAYESKIYGRSPSEVFIGRAMHYIPKQNIVSKDPGGSGELRRHNTRTALYMPSEILSELSKEYDSKAAMSMDGFFSPISFYPTLFGSTYSLSSRCVTEELKKKNVICPQCAGIGYYKISVIPSGSKTAEEVDYACPLCSKSKLVFPTGEDTGQPREVNILSLNPIVVPYGEFANPNSQPSGSGERCRHSIAVIARSEHAPVDFESLDITKNLQSLYEPTTGQFAVEQVPSGEYQQGLEDNGLMKVMNLKNAVNKDYYDIDLTYKYNTNENILLNQRFFGLRGPLMMHGWGYDTEGYPVPNAADEPLEEDKYGRPKRFILTVSGQNDYTKDGAFIPSSGGLLGDIIGKGYKKEGTEWIKTKSQYFHLNWAERPDLWPVGPIDVRWDNDRKVWSASGGGCNGEVLPPYVVASGNDVSILNTFVGKANPKNKCPYKMVYITLEEDMILPDNGFQSYPTRAFIDDTEYSIRPMDYGVRKVVYVRDRSGYTAPRGAKLLCRYDSNSGFYEPVSKQSFIVFGKITANNNAVISLTYVQGSRKPENAPRIPVLFDNTRFNFTISVGNTGMFMFENGKWIIIARN
jgi:hypothetical protein